MFVTIPNVLANRARSIRRSGSVASWLFGVAKRVATRARRSASARRKLIEADVDGAQYWGFLQGEDLNTSEWGGTIAIKPLTRPLGRWEMTIYGPGYVILKEYGFLDKSDLDRELAHWHRQMRGWVNGFINPAP